MEPASEREGICLCVLFTHPHVANLPLLRRIYQGRFRHVRFIMPLLRSDEEDVLTVYRGSFAHHAFVGDHMEALRALNCAHYVLIHDDVLLSPWLDESNIVDALGIEGPSEAFMGNLRTVPRDVGEWGFQAGSLWRLIYPRNVISGTGTDTLPSVLAQLPPLAEAAKRAARYGIPATTTFSYTERTLGPELTLGQLFSFNHPKPGEHEFLRLMLELIFDGPAPIDIVIPYPIAMTGPHADFVVLPDACFAEYVHISGVLAAAGLFVEMASPTALMLSCERVRMLADVRRQVEWSQTSVAPWAAIEKLLSNDKLLLVHPVKLSGVEDPDGFLAIIELMRKNPAKLAEIFDEAAVTAKWPGFDPALYLKLNTDLTDDVSGFVHFRRFGEAEGRRWRA